MRVGFVIVICQISINTTYKYKDEGGICHCYRFLSIQPTNTRMRVGFVIVLDSRQYNLQIPG